MGPTVKVPSGRRLATLPGIRKFASRGAHERRFLPPVGNRAVGVSKRPLYGSALLRAPVPLGTGGQGKTRRGYRMPGATRSPGCLDCLGCLRLSGRCLGAVWLDT